MDADRRTAFLVLRDVYEKQAWSNLALNNRLSSEETYRQAFVRELVYGVLRNQYMLDCDIDSYLKNPKTKLAARIILRMGFYQIDYMNSVPQHAAVNEMVNIAKEFINGNEGFINAVLRKKVKDPKPLPEFAAVPLSIKYSCNPWIVDLLVNSYGRETAEQILEASNTPAPMVIRTNTMMMNRKKLTDELTSAGYVCVPSILSDTALYVSGKGILQTQLFRDGFFSVQGETSQIAVQILDPHPGDTVIDVCAAPGGKTCAIAERMGDDGKILAYDYYQTRVDLIKANAKRLGLNSIRAGVLDATVTRESLLNSADCVLADVPCSGLGTLREKPELKVLDVRPDFDQLIKTQADILKTCSAYVKPGGKLMYSTCTINPAENGLQTRAFLNQNDNFEIEKEEQYFQAIGGQDGFYICLMRKKID